MQGAWQAPHEPARAPLPFPLLPRPKSPSDFGHPRRRATDVFIVLNAIIFALNWLSKDILLVMMAKVRDSVACPGPTMACTAHG